jgi:predicted GTPase
LLREEHMRAGIIRHPMPYGDLERQAVQRFASLADLEAARCTVEEREEYEPHLAVGKIVYAGIDYARVLALAETEADVLLWDGSNNDFPFIRPDLHIVLVDPLRPDHETAYHPGEVVLRMADIIVVAKTNSASAADVQRVTENAHAINPRAPIVRAASIVQLDDPQAVHGKHVLVVEDGPTFTHGGMPYGAGYVGATKANVARIVDPHATAAGAMADVYRRYPHIVPVLPAVGYAAEDLTSLERTINATAADIVISATPCYLGALIRSEKPIVRARYAFAEAEPRALERLIEGFLHGRAPNSPTK